ncbi:SpoIIAA family protein [Bythopirellula polymerisocia]|uniref:SpoIIAA-like protein n=1 Tax=Bythopirellula polymerisocia TaxID=2528003 RepID=A0A5C6CAZ1_9BACT|nr:STAS/SEC14 domain-containing protein [Bythopirellula polymerisocia]TWU21913.1 hypothetical protein Pla144_43800 [Bythopirellula polymerisocia]
MVSAELLKQDGILVIRPESPLAEDDFKSIASIVDPFIDSHGKLNGILIQAESFPGWQNFSSFVSHIKFIHEHHKKVAKIAAVSDSKFLEIAPSIASHFVKAEVKHFSAGDYDAAIDWLKA